MSDKEVTFIVKGLLRQLGPTTVDDEVQVIVGDGVWHRPEGAVSNMTVVSIAAEGCNPGATIVIAHKYNGHIQQNNGDATLADTPYVGQSV